MGLMAGKRLLHLVQQRRFQHSGLDGRFVSVVFENIPAADNQVLKAGQRDEVLDAGLRPSVRLPRRTVAS